MLEMEQEQSLLKDEKKNLPSCAAWLLDPQCSLGAFSRSSSGFATHNTLTENLPTE